MTPSCRLTLRRACLLTLLLLCLLPARQARTDVFGRLRITVHDAANKPVQGANVIFYDTAGVDPDFNVISDAGGMALSPPLEIRPWVVTAQIATFNTDTRTVTVSADTSTEVDFTLTKWVTTLSICV